MTTLAEHIIVAGAENLPPMLEKSMYDSWASHIRLFIKGKKHGRMMLGSIDNDECDVQATNINLYGLPPDVYALVNHQEAAKDIWDRVKLLMKGTELSYQERECRLYNLFDKMTMEQVQVNTKFLNALPSEWRKFVTDVKLAKSLYTTNYDQLYVYLNQQERHANEVRITRERYPDPLALVANSPTLYNPSQSPQHSGSLMYPPPQQFTPVYAAPIHHQHHHTLTEDLDAYDSDCDDLSSTKAALMAILSSCDLEVLSEVPYSDSYPNDMINPDVQEMQYSEQTHIDDFQDNEIHTDSNIIPYSQYLQESQDAVI
ncbi:hypothetical protein Tco_1116762 [Tanacetum coccineum]